MKIVPRQWMKHCLSALTVFLLAACGSSSVKPVAPPIGDFKVQQEVKLLWSLQLPAANQLNQTLPVVGQRTAVTASTGQVMVVDLAQGQLIWQADAGKKLQTGAGFDGLTATGVNLNCGAESTLAYLSVMQQARRERNLK